MVPRSRPDASGPRSFTRRSFLSTSLSVAVAGVAGCSSSDDGAGQVSDPASTDSGTELRETQSTVGSTTGPGPSVAGVPDRVALETVADGFRAPVDVAFAPAEDRRYIADQVGTIHVYDSSGLRDRPLISLGDRVTFGGEKGLLGLALHPEFADNRRLYVRYSAPSREGTPAGYSHTFVLAEFEATRDGRQVSAGSERTILEIPQPQSNHNAGSIAFGPDGYLYVGVGDGGAGGDQGRGHVSDWYDRVGGGNGQDVTENLLGSILRVDVDDRADGREYGIPEDNPLVGADGLDEHFAWGFRNPWRMSFDGPDLFVGDVGQNAYEEVDLVERGGNYGWNVKEGTHCYRTAPCPDRTAGGVRGSEPLVDPIIEYPHSGAPVSGISIIGGVISRESAMPGLTGRYVFGDLDADGRLFVGSPPASGSEWSTAVLPVIEGDAAKLDRVLSFGRDPNGAVYVLGTGSGGGGLHRLVPAA